MDGSLGLLGSDGVVSDEGSGSEEEGEEEEEVVVVEGDGEEVVEG